MYRYFEYIKNCQRCDFLKIFVIPGGNATPHKFQRGDTSAPLPNRSGRYQGTTPTIWLNFNTPCKSQPTILPYYMRIIVLLQLTHLRRSVNVHRGLCVGHHLLYKAAASLCVCVCLSVCMSVCTPPSPFDTTVDPDQIVHAHSARSWNGSILKHLTSPPEGEF